MVHLRKNGLGCAHLCCECSEELGNQVKVVIGTRQAGVSHVPAEIGKHSVDLNTGRDPPVQIAQRKMMPEVVRARSVAASGSQARRLPDAVEYRCYSAAAVAIRSRCREKVDSPGIYLGHPCGISTEQTQNVVRHRKSATSATLRPHDVDISGLQINLLDAQRSCLTGPQATAIQEAEEYWEDQMSRLRRPPGLKLVAGNEKVNIRSTGWGEG